MNGKIPLDENPGENPCFIQECIFHNLIRKKSLFKHKKQKRSEPIQKYQTISIGSHIPKMYINICIFKGVTMRLILINLA